MKKYFFIALALVMLGFASCKKMLLDEEVPNTPETNFEYVWNEFDRLYGLFLVKNMDWDSVYAVYRPQVNAQTTDAELYAVLKNMFAPLNDNHVSLIPTDPAFPHYSSGLLEQLGPQEDFYFELVKSAYLSDFKTHSEFMHSGMLPENLGYIHLSGFLGAKNQTESLLDKVLNDFSSTNGLVIDIRDNGGGEDAIAQAVANRFAQEQLLYMTAKKRNGPGHSDFAEPFYWYVFPDGASYTKPVIVLTSRYSVSAAETFSLAMKRIANVRLVGDTTSGAFSDAIVREMPNGWQFTVSVGDFRNADGQNLEGIGVAPDIFIRNTRQDIEAGHDLMLEKAMELLQ